MNTTIDAELLSLRPLMMPLMVMSQSQWRKTLTSLTFSRVQAVDAIQSFHSVFLTLA
jgi:hypothetical protein